MTDPPHQDKRRRAHKLTPRETTQALTSGRQQMREARAYAEEWYQALKAWDLAQQYEVVPRDLSPKRSSPRQMTPVVGNWSNGGVALRTAQVRTPMGWVSESMLSRACNTDPLLGRIRLGVSLVSLIDERGGWASPRDRAVEYAVAVLGVGWTLGDGLAAFHLSYLQKSGD